MKLNGFTSFVVLALVASTMACSKGDDNKSPAATTNPNMLNPYGLANNNPNFSNHNFNSVDIVSGKIVNRQFNVSVVNQFSTLGRSQVESEITSDSCKSSNVGRRFKEVLGPQTNSNLIFKFDGSGNLQIQFVGSTGTLTSELIRPATLSSLTAGTYALNDQEQTIEIGAFTLVGTPSANHVNYILSSRGAVNARPQIMTEMPSQTGGGFRSDYSNGQPLNQYQRNQMNLSQLQNPQASVVNSNNRITSFFESGLKARIQTLRLNEQHVHAMIISSAQEINEIVVSSQSAVCAVSYNVNWRNIVLK